MLLTGNPQCPYPGTTQIAVIPAEAGIQLSVNEMSTQSGPPAFAGVTV